MGRKSGKNVMVEIEVGQTYYPMSQLTSATSPASDVNKKFLTSATYISGDTDKKPVIKVDGQVSGGTITPGTAYNSVDISAITGYLKGNDISVNATTVTDLQRPLVSGNVLVTALTVDVNGTINKTVGTEGATSTTRGAAGGLPFLPVDEFLIGYITMTYYDGSASGAKLVVTNEINSGTKEYAAIPNARVLYHDGSGSDPQNIGVIELATALPTIHAATAAGPGTNTRNVYAQYNDAVFEQVPDILDWNITKDITEIESKAYGDEAAEKDIGTPSWSISGTAYTDKVDSFFSLVDEKKRWAKHYPDKTETAFRVGLAIVKVSSLTFPLEEMMTATVDLGGSGSLYRKLS